MTKKVIVVSNIEEPDITEVFSGYTIHEVEKHYAEFFSNEMGMTKKEGIAALYNMHDVHWSTMNVKKK